MKTKIELEHNEALFLSEILLRELGNLTEQQQRYKFLEGENQSKFLTETKARVYILYQKIIGIK